MAVGYAKLPEYRIDNAMVDFSPIGKGAQAIREGATAAYDRTNKENFGNAMASGDTAEAMRSGSLIDPKLAMAAGQYKMAEGEFKNKQESHEIDYKKKLNESLASGMQTIMDIKDPAEQTSAAAKYLDTHSKDERFGKDLARIGVADWRADPLGTVRTIHAAALGAQDPDAKAKMRAETAKASVMPNAPGAALTNINPDSGTVGGVIASQPVKAPPGYEPDPGKPGEYRPMIGGPADIKFTQQRHSDERALEMTEVNLDKVKEVAQAALKNPRLEGNFGVQGKLWNYPGGDSANAFAELERLKAMGGFMRLQEMRDASKTGGALGNVSDAEGVRLENSFAALQKSQSVEQAKQHLQQLIVDIDATKARSRAAFNRLYAGSSNAQPSQPRPIPYNGPATGPAVAKPNTDRVPDAAAVNESLQRARDAIAKGADPAAVAKRLRDSGIDPSGLQ